MDTNEVVLVVPAVQKMMVYIGRPVGCSGEQISGHTVHAVVGKAHLQLPSLLCSQPRAGGEGTSPARCIQMIKMAIPNGRNKGGTAHRATAFEGACQQAEPNQSKIELAFRVFYGQSEDLTYIALVSIRDTSGDVTRLRQRCTTSTTN